MAAAPTIASTDPDRQTVLQSVAWSNTAPIVLANKAPKVLDTLNIAIPRAIFRGVSRYSLSKTAQADVHWMLDKNSYPTKHKPMGAKDREKDMAKLKADNAKR